MKVLIKETKVSLVLIDYIFNGSILFPVCRHQYIYTHQIHISIFENPAYKRACQWMLNKEQGPRLSIRVSLLINGLSDYAYEQFFFLQKIGLCIDVNSRG